MLSDRQYMREARSDSPFDLVKWLMAMFIALYVVQLIVERWLQQDTYYYGWFGLSAGAVLHGQRLWTLFTYDFLQNTAGYTGGVFLLIFNVLGLYFFGGDVRGLIGSMPVSSSSAPQRGAPPMPWEWIGLSSGPS
jgi:membrane associated rhomboid family serine protease